MIRATNIHKSYDTTQVLRGVDLLVENKKVVSITGASGAGKTTLLHIIGSLDAPQSGIVEINGVNPYALNADELAKFRNQEIGFVFQFHYLLPEFTALENVLIPTLIAKSPQKEAKERALMLLDFLDLSRRVNHKPSQLSGGEQQRVAVARALINNPSVILADEPSGNLDSVHAEHLHKMFFKLRDEFGISFVIVTHNEHLAQMSDEQVILQDGLRIQ